MSNTPVQALAKLVGYNWEYYMTKQKIILGRGVKDVECDVVVSKETAISRQHFSIRCVPELQAFEIKNLSKNGILINGEFATLDSPPRLVRSQTEIVFGKSPEMRCTFVLPAEVDRSLNGSNGNGRSGTRSGAKRDAEKKSRYAQHKMLNIIGKTMVDEKHPMSLEEICSVVEERFKEEVNSLMPQTFRNYVRHIISFNPNIFETTDTTAEGAPLSTRSSAKFVVRSEHRAHFFALANMEFELGTLQKPMGNK